MDNTNLVFDNGKIEYSDSFKNFLRFLKDNEAYYCYVNEWYKLKKKNKSKDFITINTSNQKLFLSWSFYWAYTSKKRDYWVNLNRKWLREECSVKLEEYNKMGYEAKIDSDYEYANKK